MSKPRVEIRKVTPEWAASVLAKHDKSIMDGKYRQRPIRDITVAQYASDMKAGNWGVTGQGISFDTDDKGHLRIATRVATPESPVLFDEMQRIHPHAFGQLCDTLGIPTTCWMDSIDWPRWLSRAWR